MSADSPSREMQQNDAVVMARAYHHILQSRMIDFEAMLAEGYRRFLEPGSVAVDIGAHAGYHYTRLKEVVGKTGRVIGFEPLPNFASHIVDRHGGDAEIVQKALSTAPGRGAFLYMAQRPGESGFKERVYPDDRGVQKIDVEISTLDLELPGLFRCDFIKIDTEGHELSALGGGEGLIARTRPIISVEYGRPTYSLYGHTIDSLWNWAVAHNYKISDLFGNMVQDNRQWNLVCDVSYWDYFLVPAERSIEWSRIFLSRPISLIESQ